MDRRVLTLSSVLMLLGGLGFLQLRGSAEVPPDEVNAPIAPPPRDGLPARGAAPLPSRADAPRRREPSGAGASAVNQGGEGDRAARVDRERVPEPDGGGGDDGSPGAPTDDAPEALRTIWPVDPDGIRGAVLESLPALRECYDAWLRQDPTIEGSLVLEFTIADTDDGRTDTDGTELAGITDLVVRDSTVQHPWMEGCATNVFADLRFDPPADGAMEVTYPLVFESNDGEDGLP
jgi:hypothetical protein